MNVNLINKGDASSVNRISCLQIDYIIHPHMRFFLGTTIIRAIRKSRGKLPRPFRLMHQIDVSVVIIISDILVCVKFSFVIVAHERTCQDSCSGTYWKQYKSKV